MTTKPILVFQEDANAVLTHVVIERLGEGDHSVEDVVQATAGVLAAAAWQNYEYVDARTDLEPDERLGLPVELNWAQVAIWLQRARDPKTDAKAREPVDNPDPETGPDAGIPAKLPS